MMNLSMSHPVPNFGDALTVTCYVCGMPSSKEWAQKARSRPTSPMKPYYPFLLQLSPPVGGALLREDGSTYLCAFCHASLEAQWIIYESQQVIPPPNRKYNIQKFICAVCGVETYRKRIRALPFQEFPFLEKQRQPGSITLGNNPLAVVCLDCSETLWAQSAEYDRWGLPVQKRHFNWMARPPPPEDSVEATVARLPSGETQLPRCPPIEPSLTPSTSKAALEPPSPPVMIPSSSSSKRSSSKEKGCSPKLLHDLSTSSPSPGGGGGGGRKVSLTSTTPPSSIGNLQDFQPPVVTVAPMSSTSTVISVQRKEGLPPGLTLSHASAHHQHHGPTVPSTHAPPPGIYPSPATAMYPTATYPYATMWAHHPPSTSPRGEASPSYIPYASGGGGGGSSEVGVGGGHPPPTGAWPPWLPHPSTDLLRYQSYVNSLQTRSRLLESSQGRSSPGGYGSPPPTTQAITRVAPSAGSPEGTSSPAPPSTAIATSQGKKSPRSAAAAVPVTLTPKLSNSPKSCSSKQVGICSSPRGKSSSPAPPPASAPVPQEDTSTDVSSASRREFHIPKKRNWQVFMKESQQGAPSSSSPPPPSSSSVCGGGSTSISHHPKKKKSMSVSSDGSSGAMDLSGGTATSMATSSSAKCSNSKFRIEYLCQSDKGVGVEMEESQANQHISVIRCAPKVPPTPSPPPMQMEVLGEGISQVSSQSRVESDEGGGGGGDKEGMEGTSLEGEDEKEGKTESNKSKGKRVDDDDDDDVEKKLEESRDELNDELREGESVEKKRSVEQEEKELIKLGPNLEQFLKDTVKQLVARDKEKGQHQTSWRNEQTEFLEGLGLVTPNKKIDVELKKFVSRHERKTLPPLQLRVEGDKEEKIGRELKELLLKVSLEGISLEGEGDGQDKEDFMKELGMKTAEKEEKNRRELKWRVILMERMRRELRGGCGARGVKHEWEKGEDGRLLEKFGGDLDKFLDNLASQVVRQAEMEGEGKEEIEEKVGSSSPSGGGGMCINYPKYIPSYQVQGAAPGGDQAILKIPTVVAAAQSPSSPSPAYQGVKEEEDGEEIFPGGRIEEIIGKSGKFWEEMKGAINKVLEEGKGKWKDEYEKRLSIDKLYKHVKLQVGEMRDVEKRLKGKMSGGGTGSKGNKS